MKAAAEAATKEWIRMMLCNVGRTGKIAGKKEKGRGKKETERRGAPRRARGLGG